MKFKMLDYEMNILCLNGHYFYLMHKKDATKCGYTKCKTQDRRVHERNSKGKTLSKSEK